MNILPIDKKAFDKFGPYTLITGILLVVLGTAGILLPGVMSLSTVIFVAWLLLAGGSLWAFHTYKYSPKSVMDWIKPALLFIFGGMMLFYLYQVWKRWDCCWPFICYWMRCTALPSPSLSILTKAGAG